MKNEIWFMIPCYLGYAWAAGRFCKSCLETAGRKEVLFAVLFWGGWMAGAGIRHGPIPDIAFMILQCAFLTSLVLLLFRGETEKKVLAASMLLAVFTLAENFCESALSCLLLVWLHTVRKIEEPFLGERMMGISVCIIRVAFVILFLYGMSEWAAPVFYGKSRKWYMTLAVPLLVLTLVMLLVNWGAGNGILVRGAEKMGLYYDQIFSHLYIIILSALSMFAACSYVIGMNRLYLEQQKSGQYHAQVAAYKMLEEQYEQAERLRHDMKNHLIALSGLLEDREWEKMRAYLQKMGNSGSLETDGDATGNKVVDALLYRKRKIAEEKHILWKCDVQMSGLGGIDEFDLCVLFGNILDNAVEACERLGNGRERFIDIQARIIKRYFLLEVKNSADVEANEKRRAAGGEYRHGIGTLNIQDMVQRYHGVVDRKAGEGVYVISVLLPLENGKGKVW